MAAKDKQMDKKQNTPLETEQNANGEKLVSESRRRFSKAGVASSGIILSISSRSALGGWGSCTRSEMISGNLSRPGSTNPCGCSPGYVRNHESEWRLLILDGLINSGYSPDASFDSVFMLTGINGMKGMFDPDATLLQVAGKEKNPIDCDATNFKGTAQNAAFHAVAALFNAAVYGTRYPAPYKTPGAVISAFNAAATTAYVSCNKQAFEAFITEVDVYDSNSTWCFGDTH